MLLLDAHTHLDQYAEQLPSALDEIRRERIVTLTNAMDVPSYRRSQEIAASCPFVIASFGVHPWHAPHYLDRLDALAPLIAESPLLGEVGLDYHWVTDAREIPAQRRVFEHMLAAARDQHKIVNLHTKGAEEDVLQLLRQYDIERAIVHWYSGPLDTLRRLVERGCYFTIGVELRLSARIRRIAAEVPLQLLLTETDNPGGEKWLSGTAGMPSLLHEVLQQLAEIKQVDVAQLRETIQSNFQQLIQPDVRIVKQLEQLSQQK